MVKVQDRQGRLWELAPQDPPEGQPGLCLCEEDEETGKYIIEGRTGWL